jgi:hypothetical protein
MELESNFIAFIKINSRWIKETVKDKALKRKYMRLSLCPHSRGFLNKTQERPAIKSLKQTNKQTNNSSIKLQMNVMSQIENISLFKNKH